MANIEKYKEQARKLELKEQWAKALEPLLKAVEAMEQSPEDDSDLSLYNRVGDLYLKVGNQSQAAAFYERAAEKYGEAGFHNNAIALCNKVLRLAPGRSTIYLKLGMLFAQKGFTSEARQNLLEYAERMQKAGQLEEAFRALKAFAEMTPGQDDIWAVLAQQARAAARTPDQKEQVEQLLAEFEHKDRAAQRKSRMSRHMITGEEIPEEPVRKRGELIFLDLGEEPAPRKSGARPAPVFEPPAPPARRPEARPAPAAEPPPFIIEHTSLAEEPPEAPAAPLEIETTALPGATAADLGLEPTSLAAEPPAPVAPPTEPQAEFIDLEVAEPVAPPPPEPVAPPPPEPRAAPDMAPPAAVPEPPTPPSDLPLLEIEEEPAAAPTAGLPMVEAEPATPPAQAALPEEEFELEEAPAAEPAAPVLDFVDLGEVTERVPTVEELEALLATNADDWSSRRRLGEVLIEQGQRERGMRELDVALAGFEGLDELHDAYAVTEEILRLDPNSVRHQQKRVELAYRQGDRARLVDAYNELADALLRSNDPAKAVAVYQRVVEHDPANLRARAALDSLVPAAPPAARAAPAAPQPAPAEAGEFVDLGAMLLEEEAAPKDTRMRVQDEEPTGDEEADFQTMLQAFKRGIAANVGEEDFQSHYDLGVAYKEMGLLDEAIAEFQKALRATEGRLKSSEALGMCFFEKGQFSVAETILRRGIEAPAVGDAERIGLLYWLGRALEEQGKPADALGAYNRVFGVDITFQDVSQRVQALHARAGA